MKNLSIPFALGILILFAACEPQGNSNAGTDTPDTEPTQTEASVLSFAIDSSTFKSCHKDRCADASISIQVAEGGDAKVKDSLNTYAYRYLNNTLEAGEEGAEYKKAGAAAAAFCKAFVDYAKEDDNEFGGDWSTEIQWSKLSQNENAIVMEGAQYSYTGGAHGNGSIRFTTFNAKDGSVIDIYSLVKDEEKFLAVLEKALRTKLEIPEGQSLGEFGLFGDEFAAPANMAFVKDKLIMMYNTYEIGPYAMGSTDLEIPKEQLEGLFDYSGL